MSISIDTNIGSNLFLMMFALCVAITLEGTLPAMFNYGVGIIFRDGIRIFLIRGVFMFLFFVFCSFAFILGLQFSLTRKVDGWIASAFHVLVICVLSMSSWFCDHLARICFLPARKLIRIREPEFKYVVRKNG